MIIKEKTFTDYCRLGKYNQVSEPLKSIVYEVKYTNRENINELKAKYRNASVISSERVVFNIKGNDYRLIVDVEYKLQKIA